ncbi:uncharacterized protein MYCFIDRAFT_180141 [Pseudocercospora fijiensis CIRAD86]|uniref:Uncharacterized protein n=1 Tax=Pseudocercospora fijiensis (strain CIRAD86) TaxID=383855 RepID=M3AIX0_PSEFD|nr:uncharacterized protein MYCFIDRAFT_180141 [Pseudocercospora fijiensis CIRAD86]EME77138.1 hypothetical protein MYCFIDRAFT_180141 [Pseudocercospora fijiensis CIRAD86]
MCMHARTQLSAHSPSAAAHRPSPITRRPHGLQAVFGDDLNGRRPKLLSATSERKSAEHVSEVGDVSVARRETSALSFFLSHLVSSDPDLSQRAWSLPYKSNVLFLFPRHVMIFIPTHIFSFVDTLFVLESLLHAKQQQHFPLCIFDKMPNSFADLFEHSNMFPDPLMDNVSRASFLDHMWTFHLIDQAYQKYSNRPDASSSFSFPQLAQITAYIDLKQKIPKGTNDWADQLRRRFPRPTVKLDLAQQHHQKRLAQTQDATLRKKSSAAIKTMYETFLRDCYDSDFSVSACFQNFRNAWELGIGLVGGFLGTDYLILILNRLPRDFEGSRILTFLGIFLRGHGLRREGRNSSNQSRFVTFLFSLSFPVRTEIVGEHIISETGPSVIPEDFRQDRVELPNTSCTQSATDLPTLHEKSRASRRKTALRSILLLKSPLHLPRQRSPVFTPAFQGTNEFTDLHAGSKDSRVHPERSPSHSHLSIKSCLLCEVRTSSDARTYQPEARLLIEDFFGYPHHTNVSEHRPAARSIIERRASLQLIAFKSKFQLWRRLIRMPTSCECVGRTDLQHPISSKVDTSRSSASDQAYCSQKHSSRTMAITHSWPINPSPFPSLYFISREPTMHRYQVALIYTKAFGFSDGNNCIFKPQFKIRGSATEANDVCQRKQSKHNTGNARAWQQVEDSCWAIYLATQSGDVKDIQQKILKLATLLACGVHKKATQRVKRDMEYHIGDVLVPRVMEATRALTAASDSGPGTAPLPVQPSGLEDQPAVGDRDWQMFGVAVSREEIDPIEVSSNEPAVNFGAEAASMDQEELPLADLINNIDWQAFEAAMARNEIDWIEPAHDVPAPEGRNTDSGGASMDQDELPLPVHISEEDWQRFEAAVAGMNNDPLKAASDAPVGDGVNDGFGEASMSKEMPLADLISDEDWEMFEAAVAGMNNDPVKAASDAPVGDGVNDGADEASMSKEMPLADLISDEDWEMFEAAVASMENDSVQVASSVPAVNGVDTGVGGASMPQNELPVPDLISDQDSLMFEGAVAQKENDPVEAASSVPAGNGPDTGVGGASIHNVEWPQDDSIWCKPDDFGDPGSWDMPFSVDPNWFKDPSDPEWAGHFILDGSYTDPDAEDSVASIVSRGQQLKKETETTTTLPTLIRITGAPSYDFVTTQETAFFTSIKSCESDTNWAFV